MSLFHESQGGEIVSLVTGRTIVRVCVDELTTEEAHTAVRAVIRALDVAFPMIEPETKGGSAC